jgi:hypothetical protein
MTFTETLLFVHVLSAFMLFGTVIAYSAFALGAPATPLAVFTANRLWDIGGFGTLALGIWLALDIDGYELWDGWILSAIVLWVVVAGLGFRANEALFASTGIGDARGRTPRPPAPPAWVWHWLRVLVTLALLFVMIFKPGA